MIKNLIIAEHYEKDGEAYTEAEAKQLIYDEGISDEEISDYIDSAYEEVHIGCCTFSASDIMKALDPIAFDMAGDDILEQRAENFEYNFDTSGFDFIEEEEEEDADKKKRFFKMLYNDPDFHIENDNFLVYVYEMLEDDEEEYDLDDEEEKQEVFEKIAEVVDDNIEWINYKVEKMYANNESIVDFDFSFYTGSFSPNGEQNKEEFREYIINRIFAYNKDR